MASTIRLIPRLSKAALVGSRFAKSQARLNPMTMASSSQLMALRRCSTTATPTNNSKPDGKDSVSDKEEANEKQGDGSLTKFDIDDYDDFQPRTAGEAVGQWTTTILTLLLMLAGAGCVIYLARELMPGRLSQYSLFSEAFDVVKVNDEIHAICGESMKAYGRDTGRNTEGRRNHIDSRSFVGEDGSKRTRIRFYVQGSRGRVLVWAEVSDKMASNEFVFLICQDMRTGRVVTIEDNRARLDAEAAISGPDNEIMAKISSIFNSKN